MLLLDKDGELMPQFLYHFIITLPEYLQGPPFQYFVFCYFNIKLTALTHRPSLEYVIYLWGKMVLKLKVKCILVI